MCKPNSNKLNGTHTHYLFFSVQPFNNLISVTFGAFVYAQRNHNWNSCRNMLKLIFESKQHELFIRRPFRATQNYACSMLKAFSTNYKNTSILWCFMGNLLSIHVFGPENPISAMQFVRRPAKCCFVSMSDWFVNFVRFTSMNFILHAVCVCVCLFFSMLSLLKSFISAMANANETALKYQAKQKKNQEIFY